MTTRAPDPAGAQALLDLVEPRPADSLLVPAQATSAFVLLLAGDGAPRSATITTAADVAQLLDDLRALPLVDASRPACDGSWPASTALVTVRGWWGQARTYAARFDGCGQVVGGTGMAAAVSTQPRADIARLVPSSGL